MKNFRRFTKQFSTLVLLAVLFASCKSATMITSSPSGAKVYMDDEFVGTTPHRHQDTKIVGSCTQVTLELEGHEPLNTELCKNEKADVGAIIGGIFLLVPFLWTMEYKPTHNYELKPNVKEIKEEVKTKSSETKSKAERLRELKELLNEEVITEEEFEKEKKKILEE